MKQLLVLALLIAVFVSCTPTAKTPAAKHRRVISKSAKRAAAKGGDTLLISTTSAVRVDLDTTQLDLLRKKYGDDAFYTGADDDVFYAYGADSVFKANNLPIISAPTGKYNYLKFLQSNKKATLVKIDTLSSAINYYFFKPSASPYRPDITDPEGEYKAFFE